MSIKTATKIAIYGVATGLVLRLVGTRLYDLLKTGFGASPDAISAIFLMYWPTQVLCSDGSILLFLIVLYLKQKE